MPFSHFNLYGKPWDAAAEMVERSLRLRLHDGADEPVPEFQEAEISDAERRAAMTRERLRRLSLQQGAALRP